MHGWLICQLFHYRSQLHHTKYYIIHQKYFVVVVRDEGLRIYNYIVGETLDLVGDF